MRRVVAVVLALAAFSAVPAVVHPHLNPRNHCYAVVPSDAWADSCDG